MQVRGRKRVRGKREKGGGDRKGREDECEGRGPW